MRYPFIAFFGDKTLKCHVKTSPLNNKVVTLKSILTIKLQQKQLAPLQLPFQESKKKQKLQISEEKFK